jgi:hypothetical protein
LGNICVGNTVNQVANIGITLSEYGPAPGSQVDLDVFDLDLFDHNIVTNTPIALQFGADNRITNAIAYKNTLSLGSAPYSGSLGLSLGTNEAPALRQNTYTGFQAAYGGQQTPSPEIEAPRHVVSVSGTSGGPNVRTSLVLWNAGTAPLSWTATSDSGWLVPVKASGKIPSESSQATLEVICEPGRLQAGVYTGTISVTGAGFTRTYSVTFNVAGKAKELLRQRL